MSFFCISLAISYPKNTLMSTFLLSYFPPFSFAFVRQMVSTGHAEGGKAVEDRGKIVGAGPVPARCPQGQW